MAWLTQRDPWAPGREQPTPILLIEPDPGTGARVQAALHRTWGDRVWVWREGNVTDALHLMRICGFRVIIYRHHGSAALLQEQLMLLRERAPDSPIVVSLQHDAPDVPRPGLAAAVVSHHDPAGLERAVARVLGWSPPADDSRPG
ncbi:MAG TPA: hypothetical protein VNK43_03600 [Gemmatimonadales bacterium]|nr:hypothetical protein [Gemmatimonadales bacterium]